MSFTTSRMKAFAAASCAAASPDLVQPSPLISALSKQPLPAPVIFAVALLRHAGSTAALPLSALAWQPMTAAMYFPMHFFLAALHLLIGAACAAVPNASSAASAAIPTTPLFPADFMAILLLVGAAQSGFGV